MFINIYIYVHIYYTLYNVCTYTYILYIYILYTMCIYIYTQYIHISYSMYIYIYISLHIIYIYIYILLYGTVCFRICVCKWYHPAYMLCLIYIHTACTWIFTHTQMHAFSSVWLLHRHIRMRMYRQIYTYTICKTCSHMMVVGHISGVTGSNFLTRLGKMPRG